MHRYSPVGASLLAMAEIRFMPLARMESLDRQQAGSYNKRRRPARIGAQHSPQHSSTITRLPGAHGGARLAGTSGDCPCTCRLPSRCSPSCCQPARRSTSTPMPTARRCSPTNRRPGWMPNRWTCRQPPLCRCSPLSARRRRPPTPAKRRPIPSWRWATCPLPRRCAPTTAPSAST
ncbi:hypothetical protein D9M73_209610 [compost metagenome]